MAFIEPGQEPVADRAAFERHAERLGYSVDPDTREGREGGYWSSHTQLMWLTWQAAQAEPEPHEIADLRQACQEGWRYADELDQERKRLEEALRAALAEPVLQTCNCRWNGEVQVQQCTLHEAHVDAIHEWAERAKTAEKKLAALAEPVQDHFPDATKMVREPVQEQRERELNEALTERDDAEDYIDALLDEVLGPDRAEWSSAYGRADALEEVHERIAQMLKPSIDKAWNRFEAALEQQAQPVQEPASKMTAGRAAYFMARFKREEKMLGPNEQAALDFVISMLEAALAEPVQDHFPDATKMVHEPVQEAEMRRCPRCWEPMFPPQPTPLTVERLRDALVVARIVPPAAVEDPDGYDDGVTLHRIEALHRRLA